MAGLMSADEVFKKAEDAAAAATSPDEKALQIDYQALKEKFRAALGDRKVALCHINKFLPEGYEDQGRFNLVLQGEARFKLIRELDAATPFRQIEAELLVDEDCGTLALAERAGLEAESRRFAMAQGYAVDWESVSRLDDEALVNGIAQIAPFDAASKQALLEADSLSDRTELIVQMLQFFGRHDGEERVTLQ